MNIGIIGNGFVGSAVGFGFSAQCGVSNSIIRSYDKDKKKSTHTLFDVLNNSDYVFISVPTPPAKSGGCDLSYVYDCFDEISIALENTQKEPILILKSTVIPGTTEQLQDTFPDLKIVFNPEFLTERTAKQDFISPSRIVLGGDSDNVSQVASLFKWRFGNTMRIIETDTKTAEFIKYMSNGFFTTKISFLNDMYQIASSTGIDWDTAIEGLASDGRAGSSHMQVPGPDGKLGFGGKCFPKDLDAIITYALENKLRPHTLIGALATNADVRST